MLFNILKSNTIGTIAHTSTMLVCDIKFTLQVFYPSIVNYCAYCGEEKGAPGNMKEFKGISN